MAALIGSVSGGGVMHGVHVPKEHLPGKTFRRTPFGELVYKRAPVEDFCRKCCARGFPRVFQKKKKNVSVVELVKFRS